MIDLPSFVAGLAVGLLLAISVRNFLPTFLRDAETRRLRQNIDALEDRLERKDELIRKAVKSSGSRS